VPSGWSAASQAALRPDRLHFVIGRKLDPRGRSSRLLYRGSFVTRERCDRPLAARELKNKARNVILDVEREASRGFNGSIQPLRHKLKYTLI
jgi:hypothetical protein